MGLFDFWNPSTYGDLWNNVTGVTANFNNRQAQAKAQAQQQAQLEQQQAFAKQQADALVAQQKTLTDNVAGGKASIDSAFAQFNDPYYAGLAKKYTDFYNPQIDEQYKLANDAKTGDLAERGVLKSTVGANTLAQMAKTAADKKAEIANSGQDFANQQRTTVQQTKDNLYGLNTGAVDPSQVSAQATGHASALAAPGTVSPTPALGDVFSSFLTPVTNAVQANNNSLNKVNGGVGIDNPTGAGSSQVIR